MVKVLLGIFLGPGFMNAERKLIKVKKASLGDVKTRRTAQCGSKGYERKAYMTYSHDNSLVTGPDIIMRAHYTNSTESGDKFSGSFSLY